MLAANQGEKIEVGVFVVLNSGTLLLGDCGQRLPVALHEEFEDGASD